MVFGLKGLLISYIVLMIPYNVTRPPIVVVIYDAGEIQGFAFVRVDHGSFHYLRGGGQI